MVAPSQARGRHLGLGCAAVNRLLSWIDDATASRHSERGASVLYVLYVIIAVLVILVLLRILGVA